MRWMSLRSLLTCAGLLLFGASAFSESRLGGNVDPEGREVMIELPEPLRVKNRGGSDGAGLCVFASTKHAAVWAQLGACEGIFEWMFRHPGGGWPEKLDQVIAAVCKEKGQPIPRYRHYETADVSWVKLGVETGRMPCVTYGFSPSGRYGGAKIAHWVNVVHYTENWVGILDNNFPLEIEWLDPVTFQRVFVSGQRQGWGMVFLAPGPPPPPVNSK